MKNNHRVSVKEILLDAILTSFSDKTFSQNLSVRIVGGLGQLRKLIIKGKIRGKKRGNTQNSKWDCNAADVLLNCKEVRRLGGEAVELSEHIRETMKRFDEVHDG